MKRRAKLLSLIILTLLLGGCSGPVSSTSVNDIDGTQTGSNTNIDIPSDTITDSFSLCLSTSSTPLTPTNNVYYVTSAGTYIATGKLTGQIYIDAPELDVEIDLQGVSIANTEVSPIFVNDCDKFELKSIKNTFNYIYDNRSTDYSLTEDDSIGDAAIYVKNGDLKITGKGTLSILSIKNSGIHGKDNVSIKNVTMLVKAMNNGIKGNDKVTIEEDPTLGVVSGYNGITTSNSSIGNGGAQHGYINIYGGTITVNSYADGIDAAYAVNIDSKEATDSDGQIVTYVPVIDVYTNIYSSYSLTTLSSLIRLRPGGGTGGPGGGSNGGFDGGGMSGGQSEEAAQKSESSAKGIKAKEAINIGNGTIYVKSYDDAVHAKKYKGSGSTRTEIVLDNGSIANGNINVTGGSLTIYCSDDGVHADGTLSISGGRVNVTMSHEGVEGNHVKVSGGTLIVNASYTEADASGVKIKIDDAINASTSIVITGGYVDVAVNSTGDYDCIDSNGSFSMNGGIVIARGPNQGMAGAIDVDGAVQITGGTLIVCGSLESLVQSITLPSYSLSINSKGNHTVKVDGVSYTITNNYDYANTTCYSGVSVTI